MRVGPLSSSEVIKLLNNQFVNAFVLLGDLSDLQNETKGEPVSSLAKTITTKLEASVAQGAGRSVNTFVLSPQLELIGHLPYRRKPNVPSPNEERYVTFLKESLAGKLPGLGEDTTEHIPEDSSVLVTSKDSALNGLNVVLNNQQSSQEMLDIFRTPERGYQDYTVVNIDATAFENGGTLTIDISVGHAEASGSFDLFDGDSELPTRGAPDDALTSAWGIPPGGTQKIIYTFKRGQHFKLGATGDWFSEKGSINAFLAKIFVEPASEEKNKD